jgi:sortase A
MLWGGAALLVAGVSLLGWLAWQLYGTNMVAHGEWDRRTGELQDSWSQSEALDSPRPGESIGLLRIPEIDLEVPLVEGVRDDDLSAGVGHFPGTALPGEVGNFAVAGHRVTHGEPFRDLLELDDGDVVVVETATELLRYELDGSAADLTVDVADTWILDPVPGEPGTRPRDALITLATCSELFHSDERSVVFGHLVSRRAKGR